MINKKRLRLLKEENENNGPVVYWMSRDQRVNDNWALLFGQQLAREKLRKLLVVFSLVPEFLNASFRQYDFMLKGLMEVEAELKKLNIPFRMLIGNPLSVIPEFLYKQNASILITDFDPLKIKTSWKEKVSRQIKIPFYEVDAHNIVPCWIASDKLEFGAYTIRPKIQDKLPEFLDEITQLQTMNTSNNNLGDETNWKLVYDSIKVDRSVKPVDWIKPGQTAALITLNGFLENKINKYSGVRNDPNQNALSNLSPYLHFGQISAQRIVSTINEMGMNNMAEAFLEELIVRNELCDNFCFYNSGYDSFDGFPDWAKKTLNEHRKDKREFVYSLEEFENAETHEDLWNAAQTEMVSTGKMHGYMRMYWAKKILEWSKSPEEALRIAIYLNDKYELDGRDPNGYAGCAWAIGGLHDRAWKERPVYGKIRYMNRNGAKRKFDVEKYI
ncbi:MAG: deoxyribodipyrimidine photo-lyase, partial [Ignavibacteria bacterium]